jgi:hypothetical protein
MDGTLWYYRTLADILNKKKLGFIADELDRVVSTLERSVRLSPHQGR